MPTKTMLAAAVIAALAVGSAGAGPGGSVDPTFGRGGVADLATELGTSSIIEGTAVQPDGKIVLAALVNVDYGQVMKTAVVRLGADGHLDASFGAGGKVPLSDRTNTAGGVAVEADGKIVAAQGVFAGAAHGGDDIAVERFEASGAPDSSFGAGGRVETDIDGRDEWATQVLPTASGKIVVVGQEDDWRRGRLDIVALRYDANGQLDSTFGNGGRTVVDWGGQDYASAATLTPGGAIVVVGLKMDADFRNGVLAVERLTADGRPDTFGANGAAVTDLRSDFIGDTVAVQADGRVVVPTGSRFATLRLTRDGSPDTTWGPGGVREIASAGASSTSYAVGLQPNGKILVFGTTYGGDAGPRFLLRRLLPTGVEDLAFEAGIVDANGVNLMPTFVQPAPNGKIVGLGNLQRSSESETTRGVVMRYSAGTCSVPRLGRLTVPAAKVKLAAANCRLGRITTVASKRVLKNKIVAQRPSAGLQAPDWSLVDVTISRGRG